MPNRLEWEQLDSEIYMTRAKVPGGWFVAMHVEGIVTSFFYPDTRHTWDGGSLPPATQAP